eukprot:10923928-Heterocapsa_arctica.AAC.1
MGGGLQWACDISPSATGDFQPEFQRGANHQPGCPLQLAPNEGNRGHHCRISLPILQRSWNAR